jgi:hypothetical protein
MSGGDVGDGELGEELSGEVEMGGRWGVMKVDGAGRAGKDDIDSGHVVVGVVGGEGLHELDALAEGGDVGLAEHLAEDGDTAGGRVEVAGEEAGEGGFAAAVRAEEDGDAGEGDGEGNVVEDGELAWVLAGRIGQIRRRGRPDEEGDVCQDGGVHGRECRETTRFCILPARLGA